MEMTQDNDVIDYTGLIYVENDSELSRPIRLSTVHDENHTRQQCDRSYKCGLYRKQL